MDKKPVTQNWIEQIFEEQIDWDVDCPNACFVSGEFVNAIAAQHEQEVAEVRKHTWKEAEAHFAPYIEADDASFRLFEQYSEGGGLTPAETLEKVAAVLDNLCNALAEQIDRAVAAEEETQELRAQVAVMADLLRRSYENLDWVGPEGDIVTVLLLEAIDNALSAAPKVVWHGWGRAARLFADDWLTISVRTEGQKVSIQTRTQLDERLGKEVGVYVVECPPKAEQPTESEHCSGQPEQSQDSEQGYKRARGVIPWHDGDEMPEETIARMRGRPTESEQEE